MRVVLGALLCAAPLEQVRLRSVPASVESELTAASCSRADVAALLSQLDAGDTGVIPAGSCTWTDRIVWNAPANVTLRGSGSLSTLGGGDTTVIVDGYASANPLIAVTVSTTGTFRMAGLTVRATTESVAKTSGTVIITGPGTVRLDHLHLDTTTNSINGNYILWISDRVTGVLHHSLVDLYSNSAVYISNGLGTDGFGHTSWASATNFGQPNGTADGYFFMEDNHFRGVINQPCRVGDSSGGAKFVLRFNDIEGCSGVEAHATGHVIIGDRGPRAQTSYNNHFITIASSDPPPFNIANLGSGTALVWGNEADALAIKNPMVFRVTRRHNATYAQTATPDGWGYCGTEFNGTGSNWDGNTTAAKGYPCLDQPGRGQGDLLTGSGSATVNNTTGKISWPNQALEPIYFWRNVAVPHPGYGGSFYNDDTNGRLTADVDYYQQASGVQTSASSPFDGTTGVGWGTLARRPATCTTGVAYFATDQGSWNTSSSNTYGVQRNGEDGLLYKCTATNTWTLFYTPYTYPYPV